MGRVLLGELLRRERTIDEAALEIALSHQRSFGGRLGDILVRLHLVTEERLVDALGRQLGIRVVHVGSRTIPPAVLQLVPEALLRKHEALPIQIVSQRGGGRYRLSVAIAEPQNVAAIDEIGFVAGMPVEPLLAGRRDVAQAMERHFGGAIAYVALGAVELRPDDAAPMMLVDARVTRSFRPAS